MSQVRLLLIDTDTLDQELLRLHLDAHYGPGVELISVCSTGELELILASDDSPDAVLLAALPEGEDYASALQRVSVRAPMATIILVTGTHPYPVTATGVDAARISILPVHQLARLPFMLMQPDLRNQRQRRTMDSFPELPDLDEDISRIVANLTADYVYVAWIDPDGTVPVQYRSDSLTEISGYTHDELRQGGSELLVHPDDRHIIPARRTAMRRGETRVDEFRIVTRDGRTVWIRDYARPLATVDRDQPSLIVGAAQDITNEKLFQRRLTLQASILEMIARSEPKDEVLQALNDVVEEQIPDAICSIQLLDHAANVLRPEINSRLPSTLVEAIRELPIGPEHGACGNAVHFKSLTITTDMETDPRFELYRDLMRTHELSAVWSTPIFDSSNEVFGTFALYFPSPRPPVDHEISLLESAAQIAGIALDVADSEVQRELAQLRYQTLVEQTPAITLMAHPSDPTNLTYLSPQFGYFSEVPADEFLGDPERVRSFVDAEDRPAFDRAVQHSRDTGAPLEIEFRIRRVSGAVAWVQASVALIRDQHGVPMHWLGVMLDVSDRNEAIRQKTESDRRYRSLFDENLNTIVIYDYEGNVIDVNPAAERMSGYSADEVIGDSMLWLIAPEDRARAEQYFLQARAGISCQFNITLINKQGERVELSASHSPVVVDGEIVGVSGIAEDITERHRLESELLYQAYHDALTGLPNRTHFDYMLGNAMETLARYSELAILFMDLNNFKLINDSLGHDVGDQYLTTIAGALRQVVPKEAFVARFGGDEFTVLMPTTPDALTGAFDLASELVQALRNPVTIDGYELATNVSIGIASTTVDGMCEARELVRRADIALYDAKRGGADSNVRVFEVSMDEWVFERLWIEGDLRQALSNEEFVIHYQPLIDLVTGEVAVLEALVRWNHPERGLLYPDRFMRIAEETGHILEIDNWVMRTACQQIADWNASHPDVKPIYLGVNMSSRQFWNVGLVDRVRGVLADTGMDPSRLCIEITESAMMRDTDHAGAVVRALREHGVMFAIDDFGTGYSSLSYLREFPIDVLKIDRAFISALDDGSQQQQLVQAIVAMARALNLVVVAEGVETGEQLDIVIDLNCDLAQGYRIFMPRPFDEIASFLEHRLISTK